MLKKNNKIIAGIAALCLAVFLGLAVPAQEAPAPRKPGLKTRIIPLTPALAEVAADVLGADLSPIVGITEFTDYPPGLTIKPSVGPYNQVNLEKIKSLKPDLILATTDGNTRDQVTHLKELKLNVAVVSSRTLAEVKQSLEQVGVAMGDPARGKEMREQLERGLKRIESFAPKRKKALRVFLQLGDKPVITVGAGSYLTEVLEMLGVENVYGDLPASYPRVSAEDVVRRAPDAVIVLSLGKNDQLFRHMASQWYDFPDMPAAKSKHIEVLRSDGLLRPSLRLLEGIDRLQKQLKDW